MKSYYPEVLCIIPVYNEQGSIDKIVKEFENLEQKIDFVIIDDGSNDNSNAIAKGLSLNIIRHIDNLGLGYAVQTGYRYAVENEYSYIIRIDGDGQHDPKFIKKLIECLIEDDVDMVVGTRYFEGSKYKRQFWNTLGSVYFSILLQIKTKWKLTDPTSGFIAIKNEAIRHIWNCLSQDYPEIELILSIHKLGYQIKEVPINMNRREYGKSSITFIKKIIFVIKGTLDVLFY